MHSQISELLNPGLHTATAAQLKLLSGAHEVSLPVEEEEEEEEELGPSCQWLQQPGSQQRLEYQPPSPQ